MLRGGTGLPRPLPRFLVGLGKASESLYLPNHAMIVSCAKGGRIAGGEAGFAARPLIARTGPRPPPSAALSLSRRRGEGQGRRAGVTRAGRGLRGGTGSGLRGVRPASPARLPPAGTI